MLWMNNCLESQQQHTKHYNKTIQMFYEPLGEQISKIFGVSVCSIVAGCTIFFFTNEMLIIGFKPRIYYHFKTNVEMFQMMLAGCQKYSCSFWSVDLKHTVSLAVQRRYKLPENLPLYVQILRRACFLQKHIYVTCSNL